MKSFALDGRLRSVAKLVRQGARLGDVGTDHAYLPLALLSEGWIESAVCSDVNEGPLKCAMANAAELGYTDRIRFFLTDGAAALSEEGITDLAVAGMGGELIARIIEDAPFLKNPDVRLILQPMSRHGHLRSYLAKSGFYIDREEYSYSQGKYYVTLLARYTGTAYTPDEREAELGRAEFIRGEECAVGYLMGKRRALIAAARGKAMGGEDTAYEMRLIEYIDAFLGSDGTEN